MGRSENSLPKPVPAFMLTAHVASSISYCFRDVSSLLAEISRRDAVLAAYSYCVAVIFYELGFFSDKLTFLFEFEK